MDLSCRRTPERSGKRAPEVVAEERVENRIDGEPSLRG